MIGAPSSKDPHLIGGYWGLFVVVGLGGSPVEASAIHPTRFLVVDLEFPIATDGLPPCLDLQSIPKNSFGPQNNRLVGQSVGHFEGPGDRGCFYKFGVLSWLA